MKFIEPKGVGMIGFWWYTSDKKIIGVSKSVNKGVIDGYYIRYSDKENHSSLWTSVIKNNYKEPNTSKIISEGYKVFERGCVIYNIPRQCYEILCSPELINDNEFKNKIVNYFTLRNDRKDFIALKRYYKHESLSNFTNAN